MVGLFAEPPVPAVPVEEPVFFACAPLGPLRDAVAGKDGGRIGDTLVQGRAGEQGPSWHWALSDAVVVGRRPCPSDSSLLDVTVQTGVEPISVCAEPPSDEWQKRFAFTLSAAEGYTPYGSSRAMPRLFHSRKPAEPVELRSSAAPPTPDPGAGARLHEAGHPGGRPYGPS
ncbi:hypothetical protein ACFWA6_00480 [Streptomyces sp. NPDC060020]|uniref:hypothetical protein n=1 Tax=Streptomyces sp. NPDC060020 TaxID=3347038 RepID=UPI0036C11ABE